MKALVLAGGVPQIVLIEKLKQRGIFVILCDYYENPVAKSYADTFYQISTLDIEGITAVARSEKVNFIITVCTDQALLTVAKVSEILNLPCYIDYETALNVTNKSYMKKVFTENNISTAEYVIQEQLEMEKISHLKYPLIVKPVDCNSSKGVRLVENDTELKEAFCDAVKFSRTNTAVIEKYISGKELSVDVFVEDGKAHVLCISELEKIPAKDKFVIFRTKCPARISDSVYTSIKENAQKIADAFKLKNAPMLIQMISDGSEVYVLEFSARTGGGEKFKLIKDVTGFDVIDAVIDLTLGLKPSFGIGQNSKYYVTEFIYCNNGIFGRLDCFMQLKKDGIINDFYQFKSEGMEFNSISSSGDRAAGLTICAESIDEVITKHKQASQAIKVIDKNGNDIMQHSIMSELIY